MAADIETVKAQLIQGDALMTEAQAATGQVATEVDNLEVVPLADELDKLAVRFQQQADTAEGLPVETIGEKAGEASKVYTHALSGADMGRPPVSTALERLARIGENTNGLGEQRLTFAEVAKRFAGALGEAATQVRETLEPVRANMKPTAEAINADAEGVKDDLAQYRSRL